MKGRMTHTATLGGDSSGNITRLNNALDKIPDRLRSSEAQLENHLTQMEVTKTELAKPFMFETEYAEKTARLAELDAQLNMDGKPDSADVPETDGKETPDTDAQSHDTDDNHSPSTATVPNASEVKTVAKGEESTVKAKGQSFSDYVKAAADKNKSASTDRPAKPTQPASEAKTPEETRKKTKDTAR